MDRMFWIANPSVESSAHTIPSMSNEISVTVAIATPPMIGSSDKYTCK